MSLLAVPNVSEGRDASRIDIFASATSQSGGRLLDVHSDRVHHRTVLTVAGSGEQIVTGMTLLAIAARDLIDLTAHDGAHPRVGALDVCPVVPHESAMSAAVETALEVAKHIARDAGLPVYLYGEASPVRRTLPEIRQGGLEGLIERSRHGFAPDLGGGPIDPRHGVVCVGARETLIAFNVVIRGSRELARAIAASVRSGTSRLEGVRAIGLPGADPGTAQVSMNLTTPSETGIDVAYGAVATRARAAGADVVATELVGLVPLRYRPAPDAEAARLLVEPGRVLETVLEAGEP